jgi:hypothetical protein
MSSVISMRLAESRAVDWPWETAVLLPAQPVRRVRRRVVRSVLFMGRIRGRKIEDGGWRMEGREEIR